MVMCVNLSSFASIRDSERGRTATWWQLHRDPTHCGANMITHGTHLQGISVEQIAKVWGVSRDEAFARLHGDEPGPAIEAAALLEPTPARSSRVSRPAATLRQPLAS
jgi:hypothetical protein